MVLGTPAFRITHCENRCGWNYRERLHGSIGYDTLWERLVGAATLT